MHVKIEGKCGSCQVRGQGLQELEGLEGLGIMVMASVYLSPRAAVPADRIAESPSDTTAVRDKVCRPKHCTIKFTAPPEIIL